MQYLVVMRLKPGVSPDELRPLFKREAAKGWEMVAAGFLRQIHMIKGLACAVLSFEAASDKEVAARVVELPLVIAGAVTVDTLPLEPFTGWELLFAPGAMTKHRAG
jgi:hypothetical protein